MRQIRKPMFAVTALSLVAIGLAACGGGGGSSSAAGTTGSATASGGTGSSTVSTMSIGGVGTALVDSKGDVLYTNNRDTASQIACTGSCTAIWVPVTASSGGKPTSDDSSVQAKLGTVKSPDGSTVVTYNAKPLYSFVQDSPGQATGNGVMDSFGGTSFTWTAATTSGSSTGSSTAGAGSGSSSGSSTAGSGSSGGYGY
jgi:predicted lipoprotein with Yx(FWY)xxD motif